MSRCLILDIYTKYLQPVSTYVHHCRWMKILIVSLTKVKMLPQVSLTRLIKVKCSVDNSQIILCVTVVDSFSSFFFFKFGEKKN